MIGVKVSVMLENWDITNNDMSRGWQCDTPSLETEPVSDRPSLSIETWQTDAISWSVSPLTTATTLHCRGNSQMDVLSGNLSNFSSRITACQVTRNKFLSSLPILVYWRSQTKCGIVLKQNCKCEWSVIGKMLCTLDARTFQHANDTRYTSPSYLEVWRYRKCFCLGITKIIRS